MRRHSDSQGKPKTLFKACKACRQRRTRCDQQETCQRCTQNGFECVREHNPLQTKNQLRRERNELQSHQRATAVIFQSLAAGKHFGHILKALRRNEPIENIAESLRKTPDEAHSSPTAKDAKPEDPFGLPSSQDETSFSGMLGLTLSTSSTADNVALPNASNFTAPLATTPSPQSQSEPQTASTDPSSWCGSESCSLMEYNTSDSDPPAASGRPSTVATSLPCGDSGGNFSFTKPPIPSETNHFLFPVSSPEAMSLGILPASDYTNSHVNLMTLPSRLILDLTDSFFTWLDVPCPFISRSLFVEDFTGGETDHCSAALVRSVSCLGCRALGGYDTYQSTYASLGNRLFEEAKFLLAQGSTGASCLPDVQALGLLALHQLSIQQYAEARQFADEGVKRMLNTFGEDCKPNTDSSHPSAQSAQKIALCSAITLARFVRIVISYLFGCSLSSNTAGTDNMGAGDQLEELLSLPDLLKTSPDLQREHRGAFLYCQLAEFIYLFEKERHEHAPQSSPNILEQKYQELLLWYNAALKEASGQDLYFPVLHIFYHFGLLVLFRPFTHTVSFCGVCPATVCAESSATIASLAGSIGSLGGFSLSQSLAHLFILATNTPNDFVYQSIEPDLFAGGSSSEVGGTSLGQGQPIDGTLPEGRQAVQ